MSVLFGRAVAVTVDSLRVTGLRVQFKVAKSATKDPNTLDMTITNLAAETRARMQTKGALVILEAGYGTSTEIIYAGDARTIAHTREGTDWVTRIQCGDGEKAMKTARVNTTLGAGTSMKDALATAAKGMGVAVGDALASIKKGEFAGAADTFVNGLTMSGRAHVEFDKLARSAGLEWSIQDGVLQVLKARGTTKQEAIVLSSDTGLVGSPEFGEKGIVKVKALLQGGLRPGRAVQIASRSMDGLFRIEKVTHSGDTDGNDWFSECEVRRL